ncbi:putative phage abortive infection protein [Mitsuaria sp. PDC51]|uniref:putative phage abortive infection protein n=1 Tax=Mitsuaria sp. PDC51 TaxID=1881035 RepID=UPI0015870911|nr:putative phage abortive infection protein [Mitsuaria sp. PDC51]
MPKNGEAGKVASQSSVAIRVELPELPKAPTEPPSRLSELGQAGDAFGGANALFSAIAGALLIWAGWLQRRSLIEARKVNARQAFETTFFELLTLTRELESRFKREVKEPASIFARRPPLNRRTKYVRDRSTRSERPFQMPPEVRGSDALSAWAVALMEFSAANGAAVPEEDRLRLVSTFFHNYIYLPNSGSFGPYFRTLYQTFKLIDQSPMSRIEKERYAKIARGMVSEDAVLLLAANAATPAGHRFKVYLRRYALLEHMNPTYKRALRASLLKYVGASSFLRHPGAIRPETLNKYTGAQAYSEDLLPLTAGQRLY